MREEPTKGGFRNRFPLPLQKTTSWVKKKEGKATKAIRLQFLKDRKSVVLGSTTYRRQLESFFLNCTRESAPRFSTVKNDQIGLENFKFVDEMP